MHGNNRSSPHPEQGPATRGGVPTAVPAQWCSAQPPGTGRPTHEGSKDRLKEEGGGP
ncbi:hypothetical protein GCM10010331_76850 [Streptomyces xanthochromogenes]|nr:hypothetical protein GCM10010331_76850 [Streptomyces xanthochromogenes]